MHFTTERSIFMVCPKCNTNNPYNSTFCAGCGAPLIDSEKAQATIADASNNYGATTANTNQNYYQNSPYNTNSQYPIYSSQDNQAMNSQPYQQNMVNYGAYSDPDEGHVSVLAWLGISLLPIIPVLGPLAQLVLYFIWAFGGTQKRSLRNYSIAMLILAAVGIVFTILFFAFMGTAFTEFMEEFAEEMESMEY